MSAQRIEMMASAAQTASGNSAAFKVPTMVTAVVEVDFTAGSGTVVMDLWLQGSSDGTNWYDLKADYSLATADTAAGGTVNSNVRDIVGNKTSTTAEKFIGRYDYLPSTYVRVKWILTGSTPSLTFSAVINGK